MKNVKTIEKIKKDFSILIVTAPAVEAKCINSNLQTLKILENDTGKYISGAFTYYLGKIGIYNVVHASCVDNGARTMQGAIITIQEAVEIWKPKAIILIGIAFGQETYKIGDVLVAKHIFDYEHEKIGKDYKITRGEKTRQGRCLISRVTDIIKENRTPKNLKIKIGTVLSGEKLIDNYEFKQALFKAFPEAIGGEMEGNALAFVAYNNTPNIETVLIKGICDHAYDKQIDKDKNQEKAIKNAMRVLTELLSYDLGIIGINSSSNDENIENESNIADIWKKSISKSILNLFKKSDYYAHGKRYDIYKTAVQNYWDIKGVDDKERDFVLDKYLCEIRKKANNNKYGDYDYDKYDVRPIINNWAKPIKDTLDTQLGTNIHGAKFIFAGANYGREILEILSDNIKNTEIVSIDISSDATQKGQRLFGKEYSSINFITADFEKDHILIKENYYDVYINLRSIHSSGVSKEKGIIMAKKWLKKGGLAIFSISNGYLDKKDSKRVIQGMYGTNYSARKKDFSIDRPYKIRDNIEHKLKTWGFTVLANLINESEIFIFAKKK